MSYGRSNYNGCGYSRHYSASYECDYSEPKYGRSYSKNNCYEPQCHCCCPVYPKPQPIYPPRPQPWPTPWPQCPSITGAYATALTAIPAATGTTLTANTPLNVSFNAPLASNNITVNDAVVTFTNPGTYYVEFDVPVSTTAPATITINAVTTPAATVASPNTYSLALGGGTPNEVVSYKGFVTAPAGGTVSFTITSSAPNTTVRQGQLITFRVA